MEKRKNIIIMMQVIFLLSKKTSIESSPDGGPVENTVEYGDYKNVNGFLIPHSQNMSIGQMSFSGTISSFEFNSELDFRNSRKNNCLKKPSFFFNTSIAV